VARHTVNPGIAAKPEGVFPRNAPSDPGAPHVRSAAVVVDASHELGAIPRIWSSIGYDEINWTYTPAGKTLLKTFGSLGGGGYLVRPHYVFCSGSGFGIPHWGNGNVYHEDADGNPYYDFTIADATYDAIVGSGNHVLVELAFTPRELVPEAADEMELPLSPTVYSTYEHGAWSYPPNDYAKWGGLIEAHVAHCLERYGADEVDHWLWELWNEPDIFYWKGTVPQFCELYEVTAAAVRKVLPSAKVGGPTVTGGGAEFLREFLTYTSSRDVPLDFVSFHTKGSAFTPWRVYGAIGSDAPEQQSPSLNKMLYEIRQLLRITAEVEQYHGLAAIVDECDAGVPAHFGMYDNANYGFQNTEYYPVFQVKMFKKILDLNQIETVQVAQATSWSFYFEGERYFEGTRAFATASGIEKPLLNAYRLMDLMGTTRVAATSDAAYPVSALDDDLGRCQPEEVDVLASRRYDGALTVAVWRHADDQYHADDRSAQVSVELRGVTAGARLQMTAHRIDHEYSNSHTEWVRQGAPQDPTPAQIKAIKARQGLETFGDPLDILVGDDGVGHVTVQLGLPSAVLLVIAEAS